MWKLSSLALYLWLGGCSGGCHLLAQIDPTSPPPAPADVTRELPTLQFGIKCNY